MSFLGCCYVTPRHVRKSRAGAVVTAARNCPLFSCPRQYTVHKGSRRMQSNKLAEQNSKEHTVGLSWTLEPLLSQLL